MGETPSGVSVGAAKRQREWAFESLARFEAVGKLRVGKEPQPMKTKITDYTHSLSSHLGHLPDLHISPKALWEEFKNFAFKGNLMDMAIAVVIGAAFSAVVKSMVDNIVMPGVGAVGGNIDFPKLHLILRHGHAAIDPATGLRPDDVVMYYGKFIGDLIHFIIVAATVFLVMVKFLTAALKKAQLVSVPADPTTKQCPQCMMDIPIKARKCGHCTSELDALPAAG
jgi:large conductance mechanosensitive channel